MSKLSSASIAMMEIDDEEDIKDLPGYCIAQANECEARNEYYFAKSWLLTGKSAAPDNFNIQYESYLLEKRRKCVPETAKQFEQLYRKFPSKMEKEMTEIANAVRSIHMTRGKDTEEQIFLNKIFNAFPKNVQMEVLMSQIEKTNVEYEKCQIMLLLVKLFPDTVHQHGADLLFTLLAYESDVFSIFRKLLVTELIPAVLQIKQNWNSTPQIFQILHQCIEYYVLVSDDDDNNNGGKDRWLKLFELVDQIGLLLHWKISPFFSESYSGPNSIDTLFQSLPVAFQHRHHYSPVELAYVTVVFFLQCIVSYHRLSSGRNSSKLSGDNNSKLVLVEVFAPNPHHDTPDPNLPVLITASHCSTVRVNETHLIQYFLTATKIWQLINSLKGDPLEKEFFVILQSMKALDIENWEVFQDFSVDYRTYVGQHFPKDSAVKHPLKQASLNCALDNFKAAAECVIKAVQESNDKYNKSSANADETKSGGVIVFSGGSSAGSNNTSHSSHQREDVSFFNSHVYTLDGKGNFLNQRRVHFLSDNPSEVILYAANVLVKCLHESLEIAPNDLYIGHLITLLQLEWPSPPAENVFLQLLDIIKRKGSFRYAPYFSDFVLEPDFLEQFMALANQQEGKNLILDIWPNNNGNSSVPSRRIATRGVDKGAKNDFRNSMKRHILKSGQEHLETLIVKFLISNKIDIIGCFDQPYKKSAK